MIQRVCHVLHKKMKCKKKEHCGANHCEGVPHTRMTCDQEVQVAQRTQTATKVTTQTHVMCAQQGIHEANYAGTSTHTRSRSVCPHTTSAVGILSPGFASAAK